MSIYSDKLAHVHFFVQVIINCQDCIAQMWTHKDTVAHNLGVPYFDDIMSYNLLTTLCIIHPLMFNIVIP